MKHETLFHGLKLDPAPRSAIAAPTLLRYDLGPRMLETFFSDLRQDDWIERLRARADLPERDGLPLVPQGRHRKACLVVVDAACLVPGFPRLDTGKVVEASMVVRREKAGEIEAWLKDADDQPVGWTTVDPSALPPNSTYDPDAALRRERLTHANPALRKLGGVTGDLNGLTETVDKLHPIPADIAAKIGRTLYFGTLKTTSTAEQPGAAVTPPFAVDPNSGVDTVADRVPNILRHNRTDSPLPVTNSTITRTALRNAASSVNDDGIETNALAALRSALTWLGQETGMFTGDAPALRTELEGIALLDGPHTNLLDWMQAAQTDLIEGGGTSIATPSAWPTISQQRFTRIRDAAEAAMTARWQRLSPSVTRFGPVGDRYHVRCMLRIDDCPGCPPRILWSPLSTAYTIRPWYESDGGPVNQIQLPNLSVDAMQALTPDVAINVPPEIQKFMDKLNLDDLMNGEAKSSGLSFGMICGFSIPIITICAFIILSIFLALLNIIFFWLPYVKICIPYPKVDE